MRIVIESDGDAQHTTVTFNGKVQRLSELNISLRAGRRAKLQFKRVNPVTHEIEFSSFFGEDFKKYDELKGDTADGEFIGGPSKATNI